MTKERVFYSYLEAWDVKVNTNAATRMRELADEQGFTVLAARPQTMFDGWEFWIEYDQKPTLPAYVGGVAWRDP